MLSRTGPLVAGLGVLAVLASAGCTLQQESRALTFGGPDSRAQVGTIKISRNGCEGPTVAWTNTTDRPLRVRVQVFAYNGLGDIMGVSEINLPETAPGKTTVKTATGSHSFELKSGMEPKWGYRCRAITRMAAEVTPL